jgi:hypothetical protein
MRHATRYAAALVVVLALGLATLAPLGAPSGEIGVLWLGHQEYAQALGTTSVKGFLSTPATS